MMLSFFDYSSRSHKSMKVSSFSKLTNVKLKVSHSKIHTNFLVRLSVTLFRVVASMWGGGG